MTLQTHIAEITCHVLRMVACVCFIISYTDSVCIVRATQYVHTQVRVVARLAVRVY